MHPPGRRPSSLIPLKMTHTPVEMVRRVRGVDALGQAVERYSRGRDGAGANGRVTAHALVIRGWSIQAGVVMHVLGTGPDASRIVPRALEELLPHAIGRLAKHEIRVGVQHVPEATLNFGAQLARLP
jgi:hypothetical protein